MNFPSKEVLADLHKYEALPESEEKAELSRQYLNDEISRLDFYSKAMEYIRKVAA